MPVDGNKAEGDAALYRLLRDETLDFLYLALSNSHYLYYRPGRVNVPSRESLLKPVNGRCG